MTTPSIASSPSSLSAAAAISPVAAPGIPRATAFRLLSTLEQSGFLAKVHGAYQLGIKCFVLGNIVAAGLDLREKAHPHLVALRDETGETVHLAILDHWQGPAGWKGIPVGRAGSGATTTSPGWSAGTPFA